MKTLSQVKKDNPQYKKLIENVIESLGSEDSIQDVNNHGANAGFPGFTYYSDTHKFAIDNKKQIAELLMDSADQLGEDVINMVANFGVFRRDKMDLEDKKHLILFLQGKKAPQGTVTNVLAWFALEEVCRMFED